MKIGLIVPGFSASEQDWCIPVLLNVVQELARQHEVHVFALRYPHRRHTYSVYGATVHAFGGATAAGLSRLPLLGRTWTAIVAEGRRRPFDVLHGLWADEPGFLAVAAGRLLRVPAVVSLLGGELVGMADIGYGVQLSRAGRWLVQVALHKADRITAGSSYVYRLAQQHAPSHRLQRITLGVDTRMFYPGSAHSSPLTAGTIKLLHVGSLAPVKDQRTLLQAMAYIVAPVPDVHLHIVGGGPLRRRLESLAGSLGVAPHVTFHGAVPHERMPAYYGSADLCVLSSRSESQELVTLEAGACARTTVGTAVGLLPDLVPETQVVTVGDADALAAATLCLLRDATRRDEMGQVARTRVEKDYVLTHSVEQLLGLYGQASAGKTAK